MLADHRHVRVIGINVTDKIVIALHVKQVIASANP